jgi:hypothetical protein
VNSFTISRCDLWRRDLDIPSFSMLIAGNMESTLSNLSASQLRRAAEIKDKIESLQHELSGIVGESAAAGTASKPAGKRRKLSAAAINRIREAQKARWAAHRAAKASGKAPKAKKRKMSPAARARLAAIAKARWAKVKASGRKAL